MQTLEQTRDVNLVNEISDITNAVGSAWADPAYAPAGNMSTIPQPADPTISYTATWDAWNRLVKMEDDDAEETVAEYQYDARGRRVVKQLYDDNTLDQTRHIYLTPSWQTIEERVDAASAPEQQFIWGRQYIDDLILRDRDTEENDTLNERLYACHDANWNVVALCNNTGTVEQRFAYEPFGTVKFLTNDFTNTTNTLAWQYLFTTRELDLESKIYYFRNRYLNSAIGTFLSRDPLGYPDGVNFYVAYFVPNQVDPSGQDAVICSTSGGPGIAGELSGHAYFEFEYELSRCPNFPPGPWPVIIRVEMSGEGFDADKLTPVPGSIDVTVYPRHGIGARELPTSSSGNTRCRPFPGGSEAADRVVKFIDLQTNGRICETFSLCYSKCGTPVAVDGKNDFAVYGLPAFGNRQHCATFAGWSASAYSDTHWLSLFPFGPLKITPGGLMFGPKTIPPWKSYPDMSYQILPSVRRK